MGKTSKQAQKTPQTPHISTAYFVEGRDRGSPLAGKPSAPIPEGRSPASELLAARLPASPAGFINDVQVQPAISLALILMKTSSYVTLKCFVL